MHVTWNNLLWLCTYKESFLVITVLCSFKLRKTCCVVILESKWPRFMIHSSWSRVRDKTRYVRQIDRVSQKHAIRCARTFNNSYKATLWIWFTAYRVLPMYGNVRAVIAPSIDLLSSSKQYTASQKTTFWITMQRCTDFSNPAEV